MGWELGSRKGHTNATSTNGGNGRGGEKNKYVDEESGNQTGGGETNILFSDYITNTTGKSFFFWGLTTKYRTHFMEAGEKCNFEDRCNFHHAQYSEGFSDNDVGIMLEFVIFTPGLAWVQGVKVSISNNGNKNARWFR